MNLAPRLRARLWAGAALVPASVVAVLACWSLNGPAGPGSATPADPASARVDRAVNGVSAPAAGEVLLGLPDGMATVALDDSPAALAFAAMLPLRLDLHDPMGQAKSGQLPSPLDITDAAPVFDPKPGELYYWAPNHTLAIFYDDLGQSIPPPGLVRLGVVDSGLSSIGMSGNSFPARIEPAPSSVAPMGS